MNRKQGLVFLSAIMVLLFLTGCASSVLQSFSYLKPDINGPETSSIEQLLLDNPLAAGENIKAVELTHTASTSVFLVNIRHREKFHIHKSHDLTVIMQKGYGDMIMGSGQVFMKPGDQIFIPAGTLHAFINKSEDPSAALVIFSPAYDGKDSVSVE